MLTIKSSGASCSKIAGNTAEISYLSNLLFLESMKKTGRSAKPMFLLVKS
ncbi:hypothetical protein [Dyadobacter sp.]